MWRSWVLQLVTIAALGLWAATTAGQATYMCHFLRTRDDGAVAYESLSTEQATTSSAAYSGGLEWDRMEGSKQQWQRERAGLRAGHRAPGPART